MLQVLTERKVSYDLDTPRILDREQLHAGAKLTEGAVAKDIATVTLLEQVTNWPFANCCRYHVGPRDTYCRNCLRKRPVRHDHAEVSTQQACCVATRQQASVCCYSDIWLSVPDRLALLHLNSQFELVSPSGITSARAKCHLVYTADW